MAYDLLIKNCRIVDGSGMPSYRGDVAVTRGKIAEMGRLSGAAERTIDADGKVIAPGFIDNHCHYDAQVTWDERFSPSSDHGVTTVIMGNCAVGVAPCKPEHRDLLVQVIAGVEDIPEPVMMAGLQWDWETLVSAAEHDWLWFEHLVNFLYPQLLIK